MRRKVLTFICDTFVGLVCIIIGQPKCLLHSVRFCIFCMAPDLLIYCTVIVASSAKRANLPGSSICKSDIYKLNNNGPSTEP